MNDQAYHWQALISELIKLSKETEWVEFKENNTDPEMIGKNISALSNTSALLGKKQAYLVWGINDETHEIIGSPLSLVKRLMGNKN